MRLADIRIVGKIGIIIAVMGLATIAVAAVGYIGLRELSVNATLIDQSGDVRTLGARINQNLIAMNRSEYRMAATQEEVEEAASVLSTNAKQFEERIGAMSANLIGEKVNQIKEIRQAYEEYFKNTDATTAIARRHKDVKLDEARAEIMAQVRRSRASANVLNEKVKALVDAIEQESNDIVSNSERQASFLSVLSNPSGRTA